jgi:glycosyltransferase involved in cell wall biosynthesis
MSWGTQGFSDLLAAGYLGLMSLAWLGLVWGAGRWGRRWRLHQKGEPPARFPKVSICIPARNEARCIADSVRAALAQDYPEFEVLVVDDRSEDDTGRLATEAAVDDPRFRLIGGEEPPKGWAGKPWACQRLSAEAVGELFLFIDADVCLAPWALHAAVREQQIRESSLLSLFGDWDLKGFWEAAVVPVVGWLIRGSVDLDEVNRRNSPQAFANGQFILVERRAYERVGGHGAVRAEVLDDVRLAKAFKMRALPCSMLHAPGAFQTRLYTSLKDIIAGYSKNLYEGMDRRLSLGLGAILFVFIGTLLPFLLFIALVVLQNYWEWSIGLGWVLWSGTLCFLILLFRWRIERLEGRSGWHCLSHVVGNLVLVWILLRAIFSIESEWKGRRFVDGKAQ